MLKIQPGRVRHQDDVYLPATGLESYGRRSGSDTLIYAAVPAAIEQLTALELIRARQIFPEATHRVYLTLYPSHGVTSKHYLMFGTRKLHIGAVIDSENVGVELELLCKEEV